MRAAIVARDRDGATSPRRGVAVYANDDAGVSRGNGDRGPRAINRRVGGIGLLRSKGFGRRHRGARPWLIATNAEERHLDTLRGRKDIFPPPARLVMQIE